MATGTEAGLTRQKKAQSVYKHEILVQYILPYAAKTSSVLTPKRCVVADGFAGRGRYEDGSPGSADRMMIEAQKLKARAQVDVFLVERDEADFLHLDSIADVYRSRGQHIETRNGDCNDHLDEIVAFSTGASLFLFLDPCGVNLPMDDLVRVLAGPRRSTYPATEALLNISADAIRRSAGLVYRQGDSANTTKVDTMCGGRWWRQVAIDAYNKAGDGTWEAAADAVVEEYAKRLAAATGMGWVSVSVHRKEGQQPVYYLVFLTRNYQGFWLLGNAVAKARYKWLQFLEDSVLEETGQSPLITVEEMQKQDRLDAAVKIRANIETMISSGINTFIPVETFNDILGDLYGEVEERVPHLVLRQMVTEGILEVKIKKSQQYASTYAVVAS